MKQKNIIISIVTPSFNQGKYIRDTIKSILLQKGDFYIDYIIIDGGSTDATLSIIKEQEEALRKNCDIKKINGLEFYVPKRLKESKLIRCKGVSFRWFSEPDRGQSHALNKGIQIIQGKYFAWLNSDDYYSGEDVFNKIIHYFKSHPVCGLVYGRGICVDEKGKYIRDYHDNCTVMDFNPEILKWECYILQPAAFIRIEVLKEIGGVNESLHWCMDWDLWLKIVKTDYSVDFLPEYLACWRQYDGIKSNEPDFKMFRERFNVMKTHSNLLGYMMGRYYYLGCHPGFLWMIANLKYKKSVSKRIAYYIFERFLFHFFKILGSYYSYKKGNTVYRKLAVFSPLLPLRTGIATYFTDLLFAMINKEKNLLIDIYINNNYIPSEIYKHERIRLIEHSLFTKNAGTYKSILYQMGNNYEFHYYMMPYIKRYGGVVEMHDILIGSIYGKLSSNLKIAIKEMSLASILHHLKIHPELRFIAYKKFLWKSNLYLENKLYSRILPIRKADKIIIRDEENLKRFNLPKKKCIIIKHGITLIPLADEGTRRKIRKSLDIPEDAFLIVSAGIIHNNKRIDRVLDALSRIRDRIPKIVYILAGESHWEGTDINEIIAKYDVKKIVHVTGWQTIDTWKNYITVCDVGVNLRGNSTGEHSGPMAHFIQQGKPILISDYDQFKSFPDDFTIKIPHGEQEVQNIAESICRLYEDSTLRKKMGFNARRYAEKELSFEIISDQYLSLLELKNQKSLD